MEPLTTVWRISERRLGPQRLAGVIPDSDRPNLFDSPLRSNKFSVAIQRAMSGEKIFETSRANHQEIP